MEQKPVTVTYGKVVLEVRGDKLHIWPNKPHKGSAVVVEAAKLERWAARLYREGVMR
jgi:hypothetical protein